MGQQPAIISEYVYDAEPASIWVQDQQWEADQYKAAQWSQNVTPSIGLPMASVGENADTFFKNTRREQRPDLEQ